MLAEITFKNGHFCLYQSMSFLSSDTKWTREGVDNTFLRVKGKKIKKTGISNKI